MSKLYNALTNLLAALDGLPYAGSDEGARDYAEALAQAREALAPPAPDGGHTWEGPCDPYNEALCRHPDCYAEKHRPSAGLPCVVNLSDALDADEGLEPGYTRDYGEEA